MGSISFQIYRDTAREWRFRIVAANGETIAQSEGYQNLADCRATVRLIQAKAPISAVVEVEERGASADS